MKIILTIMALVFTGLGIALMVKACFFDTEMKEVAVHICTGCMDLFVASIWTHAAEKYED